MNSLTKIIITSSIAAALALSGCEKEASQPAAPTHSKDDGHNHAAEEHDPAEEGHEEHDHSGEVALDPINLDGMIVKLAQGHGEIEPGKELHLVVKLPYSDNGATVLRSWLGTDDRFASVVAKGEYAPSHDEYEVHAVAPDPLPEKTMWWIEIEKPDGQTLLGSTEPR